MDEIDGIAANPALGVVLELQEPEPGVIHLIRRVEGSRQVMTFESVLELGMLRDLIVMSLDDASDY